MLDILRFLVGLVGLLIAAASVMMLLPADYLARPPSAEPRSMMGSGFVNDYPDVAPSTYYWSRYLGLRVDDPENTTIVIWNHHTEAMADAPSCMGSSYFPPPSIMALEQIGKTRVYYLCTRASQAADRPFYALQRREEILALVDRFRTLGVPAERIFLAGQSGGSCSSLLALAAAPEKMNAGILFAPACYGQGEGGRRKRPNFKPEYRAIDALMTEAERIETLLVAFRGDPWNGPDDLDYLTDAHPFTIELFSPRCGAGHGGAYHGCGLAAVGEAVDAYFRQRLAGDDPS
ncbi:MAG: hypothetical protein AAF713_11940 [Pseudomonadota bacterium]